ncbi:hypothetical protein LTS10_012796 [Elasticomyces elasticus]|nr:hypothetical protein LTS10_012796 [Elasticomyces elasticus]
MSFRDIDVLNITTCEAPLPSDVNDVDITKERVLPASTKPTQMSGMYFKVRIHLLSARICKALSSKEALSQAQVALFDAEIAEEQRNWDSTFLQDGCPNVLETSSYAQWCLLQLYANQLYLLLYRQFCRVGSKTLSSSSTEASKAKCMMAGAALLDIHRQLWEAPRLRHFRWYMDGLASFCAFHGAVALATCLLDWGGEAFEQESYRFAFDAAVSRIQKLQDRSRICKRAYPVLLQLQSMLSPSLFEWSSVNGLSFEASLNEWVDSLQWLDTNLSDLVGVDLTGSYPLGLT